MDFTRIQEHIGDFGRFQAVVFGLSCFAETFVGIHMLANVFLLGIPNHRCYIPNCDNITTEFNENFVDFAIPNTTGESGVYGRDSCVRYAPTGTVRHRCEPAAFDPNRTVPCSDYVWDHAEFQATAVSDFNAVCSRSGEGVASSSIYMAGVLIGAATFGMIADRYGRKFGLILSSFLLLVFSVSSSFATNMALFTFTRFVTAMAVVGLAQTTYIMSIEFVGTSKRVLFGNILSILFACGELYLGLIAYFVRNWKHLGLVLAGPSALLLILNVLFLPESVRWLISKGRYGQAKKIILKAAKCNNVTVPEHLLVADDYCPGIDTDKQPRSVGPIDLFRTPRLRKWTINLFFNWFVNSLVYYGLSLSAGHLSGSTYTNFAILAAVEIPAVILLTVALYHCGRRKVLCFVMLFGGVACGSTVLVPLSLAWVANIPAVLGKMAIAASFNLIYIYSCEIYPTVLRSTGLGFSSMFSRVGGIMAPIISGLTTVYRPLPMIIFGVASIIAGILALGLPETHNKLLPETVDEAENFGLSKTTFAVKVPKGLRKHLDEECSLLGSEEEERTLLGSEDEQASSLQTLHYAQK